MRVAREESDRSERDVDRETDLQRRARQERTEQRTDDGREPPDPEQSPAHECVPRANRGGHDRQRDGISAAQPLDAREPITEASSGRRPGDAAREENAIRDEQEAPPA